MKEITLDYAILAAAFTGILIIVGTLVSHLLDAAKARRNALVIPVKQTTTLEAILDETFTGKLDWPHNRQNLKAIRTKEVVHRSTQ